MIRTEEEPSIRPPPAGKKLRDLPSRHLSLRRWGDARLASTSGSPGHWAAPAVCLLTAPRSGRCRGGAGKSVWSNSRVLRFGSADRDWPESPEGTGGTADGAGRYIPRVPGGGLNRYRPVNEKTPASSTSRRTSLRESARRDYRPNSGRPKLAELDHAKTTFFSTSRARTTDVDSRPCGCRAAGRRVDDPMRDLDVVWRNGLRLSAGQRCWTFLESRRAARRPLRAGRPLGGHRRVGERLPLGRRPRRAGIHRRLPRMDEPVFDRDMWEKVFSICSRTR